MHRSLKPHAQAKKVPPPAIPGDPSTSPATTHQQQIPLYRLGGSISGVTTRQQQQQQQLNQQPDDAITMSSLVSSPSLEEGGFNLPRETSVALRMKGEITGDYAPTGMSTSTGSSVPAQTSLGNASASAAAAAAAAAASAGVIQKPPLVGQTVLPAAAAVTANVTASALLAVCPPPLVPCPPPPIFCATLREPLTHKAAVYYHQQLALQEDQGIDVTQSPGRDSPGSSSGSAGSGSRHSTASLDSGRASSYLTGASGASIRGSGGASGSSGPGSSSGCGGSGSGALSSPRCSSLSSCSIGSVDRQRNDELIVDWLMEMKLEEYGQLFIAAGYDLPTIARMTPEDLTAVGIKNPQHRERIKQRIDKLQVLDNLPHFVPGSIEEWLQLLRLEEYIQPLLDQNYKTVRDVTQVTWEDLEDIGIVKLGHQKKILLAIKRVKDIISGKWNPGGINAYQQQEYRKTWQIPTPPPFMTTPVRGSWDDSRNYGSSFAANGGDAYYCTGSNHECCPGNDIVLIKVRQPRGKSLESLEDIHDNSTRSHLTFSHYTTTDYGHFTHPTAMHHQQQQQQQQLMQQQLSQQQQQQLMQQQHQSHRLIGSTPTAMSWRRSYDDGDITPTNDAARDLMYEEGGGTLPRHQRGILQRAVLNTMPPIGNMEHHYMNAAAAAEFVSHGTGPAASGVAGLMDQPAYIAGSPMNSKKIAPEPPRRHCSIRSGRTMSSDGGGSIQQQQQQPQHGQFQQQQQQNAIAQNLYGLPPGMQHHNAAIYMQQQQMQQQQQQQQHQQHQPIYANYATIQQTTAEIHCEKQFHDNKSNSSIDSIDTIPFANENTGTIKQRLLNRQEISGGATGLQLQQQSATHLHSSSSSSSSSSTNTIANLAHSFQSLKTSSSLHDASLMRSDSIGSNTSGGSAGAIAHLRSPTLQYGPDATSLSPASGSSAISITTTADLHTPSNMAPVACGGGGGGGGTSNSGAGGEGKPVGQKVSVNVLNDIGNMLANLTDELDAMLEEEKRAGLNIDSE